MLRIHTLALSGLGLLLMGCIPSPSRATSPQATPAAVRTATGSGLTVMSFNMEHRDRPQELQIVADHLRSDLKRLPDFILCQEVVFGRDGEEKNTAAVLGDALGYQSRGTKRTTDHEGVAIISRYPFQYYAERHLEAQTSRLLLGFRRVSVMGEFQVPGVGLVRVVNVHLTNWGFEHHVRRKQIQETLQWIADRQAQAPAAVTFLGGDFNAKAHWDEMEQITDPAQNGGLAFQSFNSEDPSQGSQGRPNKRIDHIFVWAPQLGTHFAQEQLLWKQGLPRGSSHFYPSDHLCLVHDYAFDGAAQNPDATVAGTDNIH